MIISMQPCCTDGDIEQVQALVCAHGLKGHLSRGIEHTFISTSCDFSVVDNIEDRESSEEELKQQLVALASVQQVVLVDEPYQLASRPVNPSGTVVEVPALCAPGGIVQIGGCGVVMMAGPCTVESERQLLSTAEHVRSRGAVILRGGAFKPSTSPYGYRGMAEAGLKLLAKARSEFGLAIITEVMTPTDVPLVGAYSDIFQIGTRNMQNYALLEEVGRSGKPVVLKRGMAATIEEWLLAAEYILLQGNHQVILCERGIRTFEKMTRNTLDISAIPLVKRYSHLPIIVDPSQGTGRRDLVTPLSLAAIAAGADGLLVEVHPDPAQALKDGAQSVTFEQFDCLMARLPLISDAVGRGLVSSSEVKHDEYVFSYSVRP